MSKWLLPEALFSDRWSRGTKTLGTRLNIADFVLILHVCDRNNFTRSRLNPSDSSAALFRYEKLNDIGMETFY